MSTTPRLGIQEFQLDVLFNNLLRWIDANTNLQVVSATTDAQPGSPTDGQAYILTAGKSGTEWDNFDTGQIAYYDNGWTAYNSRAGTLARAADTAKLLYCTSENTWEDLSAMFGRERLVSDRTYYVNGSTGSDSNDGLSSSTAFATIQKGIDTVALLDLASSQAVVQVADGTYTQALSLRRCLGRVTPILRGNTSNPANCTVSATSATAVTVLGIWKIEGFKVETTTSGDCISAASRYGELAFSSMNFGQCAQRHLASYGGRLNAVGSYTVSGSALSHLHAALGGTITVHNQSVTVSGTPSFSVATALTETSGSISVLSSTFSGSATGKRYSATLNGVLNTYGAGANFFPGNSAGTTASGGQYA